MHSKPLSAGRVERERRMPVLKSNTTQHEYESAVERAQEYIRAGDIFQVVLGQRFERTSKADPFDVYRALRAVNPSPYMVYMQSPGCILVAASPEILCRVRKSEDRRTGRHQPPARRHAQAWQGRSGRPERSKQELLADQKDMRRARDARRSCAKRRGPGRLARLDHIATPVMVVERYSHVMHISSTRSPALSAKGSTRGTRCTRRYPWARSAAHPRSARCRSSTNSNPSNEAPTAAGSATSVSTATWTSRWRYGPSSSRPKTGTRRDRARVALPCAGRRGSRARFRARGRVQGNDRQSRRTRAGDRARGRVVCLDHELYRACR